MRKGIESTPVHELMHRYHCTGPHCGNCAWWMTSLSIDGVYCGWVGSCRNPDTSAAEIEADDYCPRYEPDWIAGPDGKRYYQGGKA